MCVEVEELATPKSKGFGSSEAGVETDSLKRSREAATLRPMPEVDGWWAFHVGLLEDEEEEEAEEERRDRGLPARGEVRLGSAGGMREAGSVKALSDFRRGVFLRIYR